MVSPTVSVVITTKNEEKHIEGCLRSVKGQTYPQEKMEIIVVDNHSADRTKEIASRYTDKVYDVGPERSVQRNFGVKAASGEYILYLDADMLLSKDVVSECVDKCGRDNIVALYIPEKIIGRGFWIKVRDFERAFYNTTCIDCVRFIRRNKFLETGGFDESMTGPEDWDFDRRIRKTGKVDIIESPLYHNEGEFGLKKYLKKKNYYSREIGGYINKWGSDDAVITKQLGFRYRYFGVFTENGKWKRLLKHPVLTLGIYILRFLVGVVYVLSSDRTEIHACVGQGEIDEQMQDMRQ